MHGHNLNGIKGSRVDPKYWKSNHWGEKKLKTLTEWRGNDKMRKMMKDMIDMEDRQMANYKPFMFQK